MDLPRNKAALPLLARGQSWIRGVMCLVLLIVCLILLIVEVFVFF